MPRARARGTACDGTTSGISTCGGSRSRVRARPPHVPRLRSGASTTRRARRHRARPHHVPVHGQASPRSADGPAGHRTAPAAPRRAGARRRRSALVGGAPPTQEGPGRPHPHDERSWENHGGGASPVPRGHPGHPSGSAAGHPIGVPSHAPAGFPRPLPWTRPWGDGLTRGGDGRRDGAGARTCRGVPLRKVLPRHGVHVLLPDVLEADAPRDADPRLRAHLRMGLWRRRTLAGACGGGGPVREGVRGSGDSERDTSRPGHAPHRGAACPESRRVPGMVCTVFHGRDRASEELPCRPSAFTVKGRHRRSGNHRWAVTRAPGGAARWTMTARRRPARTDSEE